MTPDVYYSVAIFNSIMLIVVGTLGAMFATMITTSMGIFDPAASVPLFENTMIYMAALLALTVLISKFYFFGITVGGRLIGNAAQMKRHSRAKVVDLYLPYASSFVAAMAASNATIEVIMKGIASQKKESSFWEKVLSGKKERSVYPEIDAEATSIYNDIKVLGLDTVTAIRNGVERAPSPKLAEFFQGIYSTITSGGNLKLYFLNASEKYMMDNKQEQKVFLDQLALTVESYIVIAIAMPIFLIIMMVITMWVSGSGGGWDASASQLFLIIFGLLPLIHSGFAFGLYTQAKKA